MEEVTRLVESSRSGDLDAFAELVRRFQSMAHGYAYATLGDFHDAEDAAQEAFIQAYLRLPDLRDPRAFPGWFRKIVYSKCQEMLRRKRIATVPLDDAKAAGFEPADPGADPARAAEQREMHEQVLEAIRSLPEHQRTATTLFYINGYSQDDLAEFLEVPLTTVKKRLHDSRRKLKERMLNMVEETLKNNAPDDKAFPQGVIRELLERPHLLDIPNHPVRQIADMIRAAFPDYEEVKGDEVVRKSEMMCSDTPSGQAFLIDRDRFLRTATTEIVLQAMVGRTAPVRLITAGRAFRSGVGDAIRGQVFNMIDLVHVDVGLDLEHMRGTVTKALHAVFLTVEPEWREIAGISCFDKCFQVWLTPSGGDPLLMLVCGMLRQDVLRKTGFDPEKISGCGFGAGLDRLAMMKYGIDHIGKLWQPPYVPKQ